VTESMLLQDKEEDLFLLRPLKNRGSSIALDDFGVGYASLGTVVSFPFDSVKKDRSFTRAAARICEQGGRRAHHELARGPKVQATAEGVEPESSWSTCATRRLVYSGLFAG